MQRVSSTQQPAAPILPKRAAAPTPIQSISPPAPPIQFPAARSGPATPTGPHARPLVLRRHPLALVPRLVALLVAIGVVVLAAAAWHSAPLLLAGLAVGAGAITFQVVEWREFEITVRYDRVKVRRWHLLSVQQTTYALPGFLGLTCEQELFEKLLDTGTVVLSLHHQRMCFKMLTPYSALDSMIGW